MDNNEKLDFIRNAFNENTEETPSSLDRDNIVSKLEEKKSEKIKKFPARRIVSIAASFAIVLLSVFAVRALILPSVNVQKNPGAEASDDGSYDDIIKHFMSIRKEMVSLYDYEYKNQGVKGEISDEVAVEKNDQYAGSTVTTAAPVPQKTFGYLTNNAGSALGTARPEENSSAHGETNIQVEGVDEADIIKNDGEYIYIATNRDVLIYRASDLKLMSKTKLKTEKEKNLTIIDIYLQGTRLVVVAEEFEYPTDYLCTNGTDDIVIAKSHFYGGFYGRGHTDTRCTVYDVTDKAKPAFVFNHTQSGSLVATRAIGGELFTVTRYYVNNFTEENEAVFKENCIPKVNGKKISRNDIDFKDADEKSSYVVVSTFDFNGKEESGSRSYAFLGNAGEAYCTDSTLYLCDSFYMDYDEAEKEGKTEGEYNRIYAVALKGNKIRIEKEGVVGGEFLNQFSMDEYNGYFRCAVTEYDEDWNAVSSVKILDGDLKEVSSIRNLADNESIKSVRFMGNIAYVVTFENTDPLFVLDLSDPKNPKNIGEVELPGFSAYLHPVGENYIVGVGEGGDEDGLNGSTKVTLFDVSDKKNPKVVSSYCLEDSDSEIEYNPKAFIYYPEKGIVGVPVTKYVETGDEYEYINVRTYLMLKVSDGKLSLIHAYNHDSIDWSEYEYDEDSYNDFFRGTYIGETLYTMSETKICSFDIETAEKINETRLGK